MEAQPDSSHQTTYSENLTDDPEDFEEEEEEEEDDEDEQDEEEEPESTTPAARMRNERAKVESLVRRLASERVPVRVHDVIIKGNTRTSYYLIESEVEAILRDATSFQQLIRAASVANMRLQRLDVFDSVQITLDAGPPELPGSTNVVIEVAEAKKLLGGDLGVYAKPEARSWCLEGSLKLKNLFGYGDQWDSSVAYGWDQEPEFSSGVSFPKFIALAMPLSIRSSIVSQNLLNFSSYIEHSLLLSLGLLSTGNHDISYNLSWRSLIDPSQMSSGKVREDSLFSGLKYAFKVDQRDSTMRPTRGYAFASTTKIGGLVPDIKSLRLIRQEFDLRYAIPLGFYRAALNFGISGGIVLPWGRGSLNTLSYVPERFFMGGNYSPVCALKGPTSLLGFKARGLGPAQPRRLVRDNSNDDFGVVHIGGDLALTAFADLSFDLPLRFLREAGIHGHVFACTGSLNKLPENAYREFSFQKLRDSFRSSAGFGIIVPTKLFRMEVNYCYILKQLEHDQGKTGVQFSFSSPLKRSNSCSNVSSLLGDFI